jgi:conserved oligomeric Golgi complex subunit 5
VACNPVRRLFESMLEKLKSCIIQMHEQDFGGQTTDDGELFGNSASPYMEELQKCTLHFRSEFLSKLLPASSVSRSETICTRYYNVSSLGMGKPDMMCRCLILKTLKIS